MTEIIKAHCNDCGGQRNHLLLNKIRKEEGQEINEHYNVTWVDTYFFLECQGCESVKLLHESSFSEFPEKTLRYYPPSTYRKLPRWLSHLDKDWHLTKLVHEIYQALQNDAPSLASMGIRAAIEAIMIDKVSDHGSFAKNLKSFQDAGYMSISQLTALNAALELGHASIHRGHIPEIAHLETALDILEHLMHGLYVLTPKAEASAKDIPRRQER